MIVYDKLVRDNIPTIIKAGGGKCKFHVANDDEFLLKLVEKIGEEYEEFAENQTVEEFVDLLQILERIAKLKGWSLDDIKKVKNEKRITKGGFEKKIILDSATEKK